MALTGQCAVTVVKVDRTCIAILDACEKYPLSHIVENLRQDNLRETVCFYSTGFFIQSNFKALLEMATYACNNNKFFGFNFAAEYLYETSKPEILNILEYSDFIFCNKEEARAARKYLGPELGIPG